MLIEKQLIINAIKLPHELVDIIKSYVFYDRKTWEKILSYRELKNNLINYMENSLKCGFVDESWGSYTLDDCDESDEEYDDDPFNNSICYGENCLRCGNYKSISCKYTYHLLPINIICNCLNVNGLVNNFCDLKT
jgi:hypothetical protein